jgi:Domain of unknown function (DUF6867)
MNPPLPELATDLRSILLFLFVTVGLGGSAAALAGRAIAATWRPWWDVVKYMLLLAVAVRFVQFSVYQSQFLSLPAYLVDAAVCLIAGLLSFRLKRVQQMVTSYGWINRRAGPLRWRRQN